MLVKKYVRCLWREHGEKRRENLPCLSLSKQNMKKDLKLLPESRDYSDNTLSMDLTIDLERQRFPFCIVWTPLPILT